MQFSNITYPTQPAAVRHRTSSASGRHPDGNKHVDATEQARHLHNLTDEALNEHFAGQSDEQLQELADSLDPLININGGLEVDARTDLRNHLSLNLNTEQSGRLPRALQEVGEGTAHHLGNPLPIDASTSMFESSLVDAPDGWQTASIEGLSQGDTGAGVYRLQHQLLTLGYEPGPLDSTFGETTLEALQQFQGNQKSQIESRLGAIPNQSLEYQALATHGGGLAIDLMEEKSGTHTATLLSYPITDGALHPELLSELGHSSGQEMVGLVQQALSSGSSSGFIKVGGSQLSDIGFSEMMEMAVGELVETGVDDDWLTGDPLVDATLAAIDGTEYGSTGATFEERMHEMVRTGHAGIGHRLSYKEAIWLWQNGDGTEITVDGRALSTTEVMGRLMADPGPLFTTIDDLRVHGHVSLDENGELKDGMYDFEPGWMLNEDLNPIIMARNLLNQAAILQNGEGTPFLIKYGYEDSDFVSD